MFEQTLLAERERERKPYSMALSLLLQMAALVLLCLVPFVFTQALPNIQLRSVLAAPPKPPSLLKVMRSAAAPAASLRSFQFKNLLARMAEPRVTREAQSSNLPPAFSSDSDADNFNGVPNGAIGSILSSMPAAPPVPVTKLRSETPAPIRVGSLQASKIVHMVQPVYPSIARANRIQGTVEFSATIGKEGAIENLTLVRGHPLLVAAARDAVLQWRYRPTLLNGIPVEVITAIVVNFTLSQ